MLNDSISGVHAALKAGIFKTTNHLKIWLTAQLSLTINFILASRENCNIEMSFKGGQCVALILKFFYIKEYF